MQQMEHDATLNGIPDNTQCFKVIEIFELKVLVVSSGLKPGNPFCEQFAMEIYVGIFFLVGRRYQHGQ